VSKPGRPELNPLAYRHILVSPFGLTCPLADAGAVGVMACPLRATVLVMSGLSPSPDYLLKERMKTKRVAGCFDLGPEYFAFCGDLEKPETWKLPLFGGSVAVTQNFVKNALYRFSSTDIPDVQRAEVWRTIQGAAKAHGIKAGAQPEPAAPGATRPESAQQLVDADEQELKQARAIGELAAEQFLRRIGF
jgi:hypothetical protein